MEEIQIQKYKLVRKDWVHHVGRRESTRKLIALTKDIEAIEKRAYNGELGALYTPEATTFKLWAPTAVSVELILYDGFYGPKKEKIAMTKEEDQGLFTHTMEGDQHGTTYRYKLTFIDHIVRYTNDPYMKASTVNGRRSVVVDLERTNPDNWNRERMAPMQDISQTIIYEINVHDFTISTTGSIEKRGKYLGMVEKGTTNNMGSSTGIDYLKDLGVTHVQIMPFFDFATIDETAEVPEEADYNWGYDPQNYNVPEGSYSMDPYDPFKRIQEVKTMIQGLHDAGIRVIMDVVYNHVYQVEKQSLHNTVPGYYFRYIANGQYANGTGVGNETASEHLMMRKYILDSVKYWAEEYKIDGFRFDLMGIHDIETMNLVRELADEIDPSMIIYGEGWDLDSPLPRGQRATIDNGAAMPRVGHYNPTLREALKGNDFDISARGFVNGAWYLEGKLCHSFQGHYNGVKFENPQQVIQYVESHDNYTLFDRLQDGCGDCPPETIIRQHELASTIILLAQGIPHIHAGQEFLRTKEGVRDSYNKPDDINKIDWKRQDQFPESVALMRRLIAYRKQEPLFRMTSYEDINARIQVLHNDAQVVIFKLTGDDHELYVLFNARGESIHYDLPEGEYAFRIFDRHVYLDADERRETLSNVEVPYLSTAVFQRDLSQ